MAEKKSAWLTIGRYRGPRQDAGRRRRYDAVRPQKRKRRNTVMTPPAERRTAVIMGARLEEHTSELQSLMRISYAVFCLKKKKQEHDRHSTSRSHDQTYKLQELNNKT